MAPVRGRVIVRVEMEDGSWSAPVLETGATGRARLSAIHQTALRFPGRRILAEYGRASTAIYDDAALARMRRRNGFSAPNSAQEET